jgi:hypothetical protein
MSRILSFSALLLLGTILFAATPRELRAQLARQSGVRRALAPTATTPGPAASADGPSRLPLRLVLGLAGSVVGLYGGALVGHSIGPLEPCEGGCEDPGEKEVIAGALIGAALGAALLAALPHGPETCRYSVRFLRGLFGSAIGVAIGARTKDNTALVTVPLGALLGGALGAESCTWQRHN